MAVNIKLNTVFPYSPPNLPLRPKAARLALPGAETALCPPLSLRPKQVCPGRIAMAVANFRLLDAHTRAP